jgi:hypothetical protein
VIVSITSGWDQVSVVLNRDPVDRPPFRHQRASHGLASRGLASRGLASHGLASRGLASRGLASRGLASRGLASRGLASRGLASRGLASRGLASTESCRNSTKKIASFQTNFPGLDVMITIFSGFANFRRKNWRFFSKTDVMINFFQNLALF